MKKVTIASVLVGLAAVALPGQGQASAPTTYSAPWPAVHEAGSAGTFRSHDRQTGSASIVQLQVNTPSGGLGCSGRGGLIEFEQTTDSHTGPISKISLDYQDALVGPYAFMKLSIRKDGEGLQASLNRGIFDGDGTVVIELTDTSGAPTSVEGPLEIWFGLEMSSGCPPAPPFDFAQATFTTLTVE